MDRSQPQFCKSYLPPSFDMMKIPPGFVNEHLRTDRAWQESYAIYSHTSSTLARPTYSTATALTSTWQEVGRSCVIELVHCPKENQIADIMTKALKLDTFVKLRELLGVRNVPEIKLQIADIMTKALKLDTFVKLRELLGVRNMPEIKLLAG